jgi:hypothetical protein
MAENSTNLYDEIIHLLSIHGKTVDDIEWVECVSQHAGEKAVRKYIPIVNFILTAKETYYDQNKWRVQIPTSLKIRGKDRSFLIVVHVYDGSENLEYIDMEEEIPEQWSHVKSLLVEKDDYYFNPVWKTDDIYHEKA